MDPLLATVAEEFDLGTPLNVAATPYGWHQVVRLTTERGQYIVKPARHVWEVELYHRVQQRLNTRGVRQARLFLTSKGSPVGSTGHFVQELLPGTAHDELDDSQSTALFGHLPDYDAALEQLAVPREVTTSDTIWSRVLSPDHLIAELPGLVDRHGPTWLERAPVDTALERLGRAVGPMIALPKQLVHSDIGPDNVMYDGDDLIGVIDFTPHYESRLFGVGTALYWCHVHREHPTLDRIRPDFAAYGVRRPWTASEVELLEPMVLREAIRRLATPLAVTDETGGTWSDAALRRRYEALKSALAFGSDSAVGSSPDPER